MNSERKGPSLWDRFDPEAYIGTNYSEVSEQDAFISRCLAESWAAFGSTDSALEIGAGPNLYPILAAVPWVERIDAVELGAANRIYLEEQIESPDPKWENYLVLMQDACPDRYGPGVPASLTGKVRVSEGSIFDLPEAKWDAGSMHFVAESITDDIDEFKVASRRFLQAIKPGGLILASFMLGSEGYRVGDEVFPAVPVREPEVVSVFAGLVEDLEFRDVPDLSGPVRSGYESMGFLSGIRRAG